ncbi:putative receptor protein-tyrosine kinase [Helianthus annuus]|nr:putative receptor protein-tyrosine kinase [Helianthus annuus]KAJ0915254.1 putative receptor protein-tyrosine kinase [Helianthus annuus]
MNCCCGLLFFSVFALLLLVPHSSAHTDVSDVKALQDLYTSFNSPPQLKGWKSSGGDPCEESWIGVYCVGSSIVQMDLSNNNIYGEIPYGLPLNLTHLNLACNNLSQYIPYSLSSMRNLRHMDLSYNEFIGDLPSSFATLKGLSKLSVCLSIQSINIYTKSVFGFISLWNKFTGTCSIMNSQDQ